LLAAVVNISSYDLFGLLAGSARLPEASWLLANFHGNPGHWESKPHLPEPWDFFHCKTRAQRENIRHHNIARGDSNTHPEEFDRETRIPVLVETTGSLILAVKLRKE
jgi:hypothetical protein